MADTPDIHSETHAASKQKLEAAIGAEVRRQRKRQDMTMAMLSDAAGVC